MPVITESFVLTVQRDTRTGQVITTGKYMASVHGEPAERLTGRAVRDFHDAMSLVAGAAELNLTVASNRLMGRMDSEVEPGSLLGMVEYHVREAYRQAEAERARREAEGVERADGPEGADPAEPGGPGTQGREGAG